MFNYAKSIVASAKAAVMAAIASIKAVFATATAKVKAAVKTAVLAAAAIAALVLVFTPAASLIVACAVGLVLMVTIYTIVAILCETLNALAVATATVSGWLAFTANAVEGLFYVGFAYVADLTEHVRSTRRRRILAARRRFVSAWSRIREVTLVTAVPVAAAAPIVVATEEVEVVAAPVPTFTVGADLEAARGGVRELRKAARKLAKAKLDRGNRRAEMPSETRAKRVELQDLILG